jgi:flagellum-specific ATP synthase
MQNLLSPADLKMANRFRRLWSLYQQNVDLIQVGAYQAGSNPEIDQAIAMREAMEDFLRQDMYSGVEEDRTRVDLRVLMEL